VTNILDKVGKGFIWGEKKYYMYKLIELLMSK